MPQTNYAPPRRPSTKVEVDYILWWLSRSPIHSTLLTRGNAADAMPGALGQPGTAALFGPGGQNYSAASGIRLSFETWEPSEQVFGFSVSGFWLAPQFRRDRFSNDGSNTAAGLYLPFFNPNAASNNAILLAGLFTPGVTSAGTFTATSKVEFWGTDLNGLCNFVRTDCWTIDGIFGVKYLQLDEGLTLETTRVDSDGLFFRTSSEHFGTRNQFVGGTLGGRGEFRWGKWTTSLLSTISIGNNFQNLLIDGQSTRAGGAAAVTGTTPGFVYVQPSNMGRFASNDFSFVSVLQAKAGYQISERLRGLFGYEFTYWTDVLRPGNQIDSTVNLSQNGAFGTGTLSGAARPTVPRIASDFWAHGLTLGLEYRY
ncbi:MAG: BBP7 family outer membrane beta-barrel protein [Gemmataceae bacterium]|nr:BBP7 family outer membrane beta-barrel protein [Gemmataceae bacterium]